MGLVARWTLAVAASLATFTASWWGLEAGAEWHLGDALALAAVPFTVVFGITGYWAGRERQSGGPGSSGDRPPGSALAGIADRLAQAVQQQWEQEAGIRRLYDPYPLAVSWTAADPALTDDWAVLERLARSTDWPAATQPQQWARCPDELAGEGDDLERTLTVVPTQRLVVLGEPGTGKTMLMVRLVLSLLRHRHGGDPVPVLMPLASWDPMRQDLREWLRSQMRIEHPALAAPAPADTGMSDCANALLARGLILPILDGLDEIPPAVRGPAIARINDALGPGGGVVVTCRTTEYRSATRPREGPEVNLRAAAAVQLNPLGTGKVAEYLLADAGGPAARARWAPVLTALGTGIPVAQALTTPLMISLARLIYNPRPGEVTEGALWHKPTELLNRKMFRTREDVEDHLFDRFVWAAYRPRPSQSSASGRQWSYEQASQWLAFLARHQEDNKTLDIVWWKLSDAVPGNLIGLVLSVTLGTIAAVGYAFAGLGLGITLGLLIGLIVRRLIRPDDIRITRGITGGLVGAAAAGLISFAIIGAGQGLYSVGSYFDAPIGVGIAASTLATLVPSLAAGFTGELAVAFYEQADIFHGLRTWVGAGSHVFNGIGIGLAAMLIVQYARRRKLPAYARRWSPTWFIWGVAAGVAFGFVTWVQLGLLPGLAIGLAAALVGGVNGRMADVTASDPASSASPGDVLRRDRGAFLGSWLVFGVGMGVVTGVWLGLNRSTSGTPNGVWFGLEVGLTNFIALGLGLAFIQALSGLFYVSQWWLAIRGKLPWRLMAFLHDAHANRGVLRQVGAVYQFRHVNLQRRIASWSATNRPGT